MSFIDIYFLLSIFVFSFYFCLISTFGFAFFIFSNRDNIKQKLDLSLILISFSIGLSFHLVYSFIMATLKIFNFYTIYLPFIVIDIFLFYYIIKKRGLQGKKLFKNFSFINIFKKIKNHLLDLIILIIIFIMLYLLQMYFIWQSVSYPACDPYFWFENIWFVHENGFLNYTLIETFPPGFTLFNASMILITDDYYLIYFFLKYIPIFLAGINILVLFVIARSIFKNKINVFFTLAIYLSFNYLSYRYQMLLPSTLATTLSFLFLLCLLKKNSITILETKGLILSGIFMTHHLYFLYYFILYFFYTIIILIKNLNFKRKNNVNPKYEKTVLIKKFFINQIYIYSIVLIMILPFLVITSIKLNSPVLNYYFSFVNPLYLFNSLNDIIKIGDFFIKIAVLLMNNFFYNGINNFILKFFERGFISSLDIFYFQTLGIGIVLIIISLFLPLNKLFKFNPKQKNMLTFIKFTLIFSILSYLFLFLLENYLNISLFSKLIYFISEFFKRYFELFAGLWALLFVLAFNFIFIYIKIKLKKLVKITRNKKKILRKLYSITFYTQIIILISFFYLSNFKRVQYFQYFSDGHTDVILFAGNYFNENPPNDGTVILLEEVEYKYNLWYTNYNLLANSKLIKIYFNFTHNLTYLMFKVYYESLNVEYTLFNINNLTESFVIDFELDFDILYHNNDDWLFAKLKL